jgi:hypothetical protein
MDRWTDGQTDRWTDNQTDRQTNRQTDGKMERWTNGHTVRWTDKQMDIQTDGQMDRRIDINFWACSHTYLNFLAFSREKTNRETCIISCTVFLLCLSMIYFHNKSNYIKKLKLELIKLNQGPDYVRLIIISTFLCTDTCT